MLSAFEVTRLLWLCCLLRTTAALERALQGDNILPAQLRGHQRVRVTAAKLPRGFVSARTKHRAARRQRSAADGWEDWGFVRVPASRTAPGSLDASELAAAVDPPAREPDMEGVGDEYQSYSPLLDSVNTELAAAKKARREEYRRCSEVRAQSLQDIEAKQQELYELKTADDSGGFAQEDGASAKLRVERQKERLQAFLDRCEADERRLREELEDVDRHKQITQGMLDDNKCDGASDDEIPNCEAMRQQMEALDTEVDNKRASIEGKIVEVQENCTKNRPIYEEAVTKAEEDAAKYDDQMTAMLAAKTQREEAIKSKSAELEQQQAAFEAEMKTCQENIRARGKEIKELQEMKTQLEKLDSREREDTGDFDASDDADFDASLEAEGDQAEGEQAAASQVEGEQEAASPRPSEGEQAAASPQPRAADLGARLRLDPPEPRAARNITHELREKYPDFQDPGSPDDAGRNVAGELAEKYPDFKPA